MIIIIGSVKHIATCGFELNALYSVIITSKNKDSLQISSVCENITKYGELDDLIKCVCMWVGVCE